MVEVFGAGTIVHFNPKDLGLNAGFLGLFSDSPGAVFRKSGTEIPELFSDSPEQNFWDYFRQSWD